MKNIIQSYISCLDDLKKEYGNFDNFPVFEADNLNLIRKDVCESTGLSENELTFIYLVRKHKIFRDVNTYCLYLVSSLEK